MQKIILSEQSLYYGDVAMPKDWDIDRAKKIDHFINMNELVLYQFPLTELMRINFFKFLRVNTGSMRGQ